MRGSLSLMGVFDIRMHLTVIGEGSPEAELTAKGIGDIWRLPRLLPVNARMVCGRCWNAPERKAPPRLSRAGLKSMLWE